MAQWTITDWEGSVSLALGGKECQIQDLRNTLATSPIISLISVTYMYSTYLLVNYDFNYLQLLQRYYIYITSTSSYIYIAATSLATTNNKRHGQQENNQTNNQTDRQINKTKQKQTSYMIMIHLQLLHAISHSHSHTYISSSHTVPYSPTPAHK